MTSAVRPLGNRFARDPVTVSNDEDTAVVATLRPADDAADHLHNRDDPSVSVLAEILREVQDSLTALDERLVGIEGAQTSSGVLTRQLAENIVDIGAALARRVKVLERAAEARSLPEPHRPAAAPAPETQPAASTDLAPKAGETVPLSPYGGPAVSTPVTRFAAASRRHARAPLDTWVLALGATVLVVVVGAGLWFMQKQSSDRAAAAAEASQEAAAPAPIPATATPASAPAASVSPPADKLHHYSLYPVHHGRRYHYSSSE